MNIRARESFNNLLSDVYLIENKESDESGVNKLQPQHVQFHNRLCVTINGRMSGRSLLFFKPLRQLLRTSSLKSPTHQWTPATHRSQGATHSYRQLERLVMPCWLCITFLAFLSCIPGVILVEKLDPNGKNVCLVEEKFTVTVQVEEEYKYWYTYSKWCFSIPPRCSVQAWRWATRTVPKQVNQTRNVPQCCQGYVPDGKDCKPTCRLPCRHGACTKPDYCTCFPGFHKAQCQEICTRGRWGDNCTQHCECQNDAFCNPMSGACLCTPGWRGRRCTEPCKEGLFGIECRRPCYCDGLPCHHITGDCIIPTTESTSTTEFTTSSTTEYISTTDTPTTESTSTTETSTTSTTTSKSVISTISDFSSTDTYSTTTIQTRNMHLDIEDFPFSTSTEFSTSTSVAPSEELRNTTITSVIEEVVLYSNATIQLSGDTVTERPTLELNTSRSDLASLAVTIALSVGGSLLLLFAAAAIALARHRKSSQVNKKLPSTDTGLYRFYAEEPPVKAVFLNPTYGCTDLEIEQDQLNLDTFKIVDDSFEAELREIIESQYDYPPYPISRTSTPFDQQHLYDEIGSSHENRDFSRSNIQNFRLL